MQDITAQDLAVITREAIDCTRAHRDRDKSGRHDLAQQHTPSVTWRVPPPDGVMGTVLSLV